MLGDAGFVRRPTQPIISYLAKEQAEEEKKGVNPVAVREPVGFIGLDDDDDHGLERAFGNYFMRKGEGGDSADDRGGGNTPETTMQAAMD